jgi:hypothetical protein
MVADGRAEFSATSPEWRAWLEAFGISVSEVWSGLHKQARRLDDVGRGSLPDSVQVSAGREPVEREKLEALRGAKRGGTGAGLGLAAYQRRSGQPSESIDEELSPELRERLEANGAEWAFFQS